MAERVRHPWETKEMRKLFDAIVSLETRAEAERFFRDLCTLSELEAMAHRWEVVRLLERGLPYPITFNIGEVMEGYRRAYALASSPEHVIPGHDPLVMERLHGRIAMFFQKHLGRPE